MCQTVLKCMFEQILFEPVEHWIQMETEFIFRYDVNNSSNSGGISPTLLQL